MRQGQSTDPSWHNIQASNQQWYSYCYSGGDNGAGGLEQIVGQGRDTAPLQLIAEQNFQISAVTFTGDDSEQLSRSGNSGRADSIVDANTQIETAEYSIIVTDTANGTIECDPEVKNKPPAK